MMLQDDRDLLWSRQNSLVQREGVVLTDNILIVGCGSLGSHAAMALVSIGYTNFTLWDGDTVEMENIFPTVYDYSDIHLEKAIRLASILDKNGASNVEVHTENITREHDFFEMGPYGITVIAVDDWEARQWLVDQIRSDWIMDARMGGTVGFLYTIDNMDEVSIGHYMREMRTAKPGELACGQKATSAVVNWVRWRVAASATAIANGEQPKFMARYDMQSDLQLYPTIK